MKIKYDYPSDMVFIVMDDGTEYLFFDGDGRDKKRIMYTNNE